MRDLIVQGDPARKNIIILGESTRIIDETPYRVLDVIVEYFYPVLDNDPTKLNKKTFLDDDTVFKTWGSTPPENPTPNLALHKLASTLRTEAWLNGQNIDFKVFNGTATSALQRACLGITDAGKVHAGNSSGQAKELPIMEYGSYVGTGTYGYGTSNSLTFNFEPRAVFVFPNINYSPLVGMFRNQTTVPAYFSQQYGSFFYLTVTWGTNTVSWTTTGNSAGPGVQLNTTNATYYYLALA